MKNTSYSMWNLGVLWIPIILIPIIIIVGLVWCCSSPWLTHSRPPRKPTAAQEQPIALGPIQGPLAQAANPDQPIAPVQAAARDQQQQQQQVQQAALGRGVQADPGYQIRRVSPAPPQRVVLEAIKCIIL